MPPGRKLGDDDYGAYARACAQPGHACLEDDPLRCPGKLRAEMQPKPHRLPLFVCESARASARLASPKFNEITTGLCLDLLELLMELLQI